MVYYFTSSSHEPAVLLYMGKDKFENEELIKHALDIDVWFHVDKLSSAHVYLRLPTGITWDTIPDVLLADICQLTKANSIEGNKSDNQTIIYTPQSNLKKTEGMETGQVTFFKSKMVKRFHVSTKENSILNRLNKTKLEEYPDLQNQKIQYEKKIRQQERLKEKADRLEEDERIAELKKNAGSKNYKDTMKEENMTSNKELLSKLEELGVSEYEASIALEEDFM